MENMLRSEAKAWKRRGVMVAQWHDVCIWGVAMILSILAAGREGAIESMLE